MGKIEAPIAVVVTQTKIEIAPPAAKPKATPKKKPARTVVVTQTHKVAKPEVKKATPKAPKTPAPKPTKEPNLAAKNQEAVQAGGVPSRNKVEPGRYDMLLS